MAEADGDGIALAAALAEIERAMADADQGGHALEPWIAELADELRAAVAEAPEASPLAHAATLADAILAAPALSRDAQHAPAAPVVRALAD